MGAEWRLSQQPSEYFRENVYMTFQDDRVAFQCIDMLDVDRLMWANDHPHSDATWPHSQEILDLNTGVPHGRAAHPDRA